MDEVRIVSGIELPARDACGTGTVIAGACTLESDAATIELCRGDSFVIPAGVPVRLGNGSATAILTSLV